MGKEGEGKVIFQYFSGSIKKYLWQNQAIGSFGLNISSFRNKTSFAMN